MIDIEPNEIACTNCKYYITKDCFGMMDGLYLGILCTCEAFDMAEFSDNKPMNNDVDVR